MKKILTIFTMKGAMISFIFILHFSLFISLCKAQIITTEAGNGITGYSGDGGPATAAEFNFVFRSFMSDAGNVYIDDLGNNCIRVVNTAGIISTYAGDTVAGFSGDGGPATAAEFHQPVSIAMDASGNLYIGDYYNQRVRVVRTTGIIETYAGTSVSGYSGDGGPATAAEMTAPFGLYVDATDNLFMVDQENFRIREINTSGIITTIAGNGVPGFSGDGGLATAAEIYYCIDVSKDGLGNVYFVDNQRIRKIAITGVISTFAGNGLNSYSGDGGAATDAELNDPNALTVDSANNVYIADQGNSRIRMVNTSGIINTVIGNGVFGYSGDGGPPLLAELNSPSDVKIHRRVVCIADLHNDLIRMVSPLATGIEAISHDHGITIYPNPNDGKFTLQMDNAQLTIDNGKYQIQIYNVLGEQVYSKSYQPSANGYQPISIDLSSQPNGVYLYRVVAENGELAGVGKVIIQK